MNLEIALEANKSNKRREIKEVMGGNRKKWFEGTFYFRRLGLHYILKAT